MTPFGDYAAQRQWLLAMLPKGAVGAEIGVYRGEFSARILETVEPQRLHLIDPWLCQVDDGHAMSLYGRQCPDGQDGMNAYYDEVRARFRAEIIQRRVLLHRARSEEIATDFPDDYFDWIYVDGDHNYAAVRADLESYFPKVKTGGFIAGDDYALGGWWRDGVVRAVNEFIGRHSVMLTFALGSQYLLRKL